MVFISILTLIVAKALPVLNSNISSVHFTRITSIIFFITGYFIINSLNLQSIDLGIGVYSGLFHITPITQLLQLFLFIIGGLILISWPLFKNKINNNYYSNVLFVMQPAQVSLASAKNLPTEVTDNNTKSPNLENINIKTEDNNIIENNGEILTTETYSRDYSLIVLFSSLGSALLINSYDLISLYLSIELQSFGLYVLTTLYRDSESSTAAGLKYFLLGGLASCIILLGTGIVYSYTGITNFESLYLINSISDLDQQYIIQGLSLGLILIFVGFLFKMAAAPLHNWSPDVYDGTPTIVTIWLTIIPKISILIILLELQTKLGIIGGNIPLFSTDLQHYIPVALLETNISIPYGTLGTEILNNINILSGTNVIKNLLLISSLLSLIIGSILGLAQIRIKRLLAYSTISHIGFLLLALAINSEQSIDSFIFYILQYTITNLNIFLIILALTYLKNYHNDNISINNSYLGAQAGTIVRDLSYIIEFKNLFFSNPFLSLSLGVSLFSLAGVPPLIGFFSKQFVLYSSLQEGYYFISIVAILVSVISASYYLKIIKLLFTQMEHAPYPSDKDKYSNKNEETERYSVLSSNKALKEEKNGIEVSLENENKILLTNTHSFIISTLTLFIILFFIKPSIILNSTQLLSLSLFYI